MHKEPKILSKNRALVIAHFHSTGKVRSDTINFLQECEGTFKKVIFVSTNLSIDEKVKIPKFIECHVRENIGYDFFSYRLGLEQLFEDIKGKNGMENTIDQVTVMNTSFLIFDPKNFLKIYFNEGLGKNDFYGLTMHPGPSVYPHLQSFLLTFNKVILQDSRVTKWWRRMVHYEEKSLIIKKYEIGLTKYLNDLGYKSTPFFPLNQQSKYADPMHGQFLEILIKYSILKIGVFVVNPFKLSMNSLNIKIKESAFFKGLIIEAIEN